MKNPKIHKTSEISWDMCERETIPLRTLSKTYFYFHLHPKKQTKEKNLKIP